MQLLILRHADAEPSAATDAGRSLTKKGREQAERVGRFCAARSICPDLILTSPYLRATQTAGIVAGILEREMVAAPFLASGMAPSAALEELKAYDRFGTVMIVGHEPDLGDLIAALLRLKPAALHIRKASLHGLEVGWFRAEGATLDFSIPVKLM